MQVVVNDIPRTRGNVIVKLNGVDRECEKVQLNDGTVIWEIGGGSVTVDVMVEKGSITPYKPAGQQYSETKAIIDQYASTGYPQTVSMAKLMSQLPAGAILDSINRIEVGYIEGFLGVIRPIEKISLGQVVYDVQDCQATGLPEVVSFNYDTLTIRPMVKVTQWTVLNTIKSNVSSSTYRGATYEGTPYNSHYIMNVTYHMP